MTCEQVRARMTAYLDGELEDERGSAVRGHLRACEACRQVATDEAALRDGLRALPPVDPPASLWSGVQARLAAAEIADAERPAWRMALARWFAPRALMMRMSIPGAVVAALVLVLVWRSHRTHEQSSPAPVEVAATSTSPVASAIAPTQIPTGPRLGDAADVSVELAALPEVRTRGYADAAAELLTLAKDERAAWSDGQRHAFDARIAELRAAVEHAEEGPARQRAYRGLVRYLQRAVVRDDVAVNDRAGGAL
jgi:hypothetical protein